MELQIEQVAIKYKKDEVTKMDKYDRDYWTIDLEENNLEFNKENLKKKFTGLVLDHQGYRFIITQVDYYSLRNDKCILTAIKQ